MKLPKTRPSWVRRAAKASAGAVAAVVIAGPLLTGCATRPTENQCAVARRIYEGWRTLSQERELDNNERAAMLGASLILEAGCGAYPTGYLAKPVLLDHPAAPAPAAGALGARRLSESGSLARVPLLAIPNVP